MSEANKQLVRRWFQEVWTQKDESAIDAMFCSDGRSYGFPEPDSVITGPEEFKQQHRVFCGTFPDMQFTMNDLLAENDRVAVRWSIEMTHSGDALGIPITGRRIHFHGASFLIIRDGKIVEGWNEMNINHLFAQLQS